MPVLGHHIEDEVSGLAYHSLSAVHRVQKTQPLLRTLAGLSAPAFVLPSGLLCKQSCGTTAQAVLRLNQLHTQ